ncbi:MAG: translation initiation factor eIF-1A [Candidatus Poseidoniaceae archaeon]|nr:translation initiation factor eIF-1A [Candidatus Poseidoniaceae archaeon]
MGRRYEEKVDVEELARLENPEDSSGGKIRVKMPNRKINEMFAFAEQILGGRRVTVLCEDGETRMARIPGKMRRRQWVRDGDLIIVWPWDFQDAKADVKHRYSKTQAMYLSRKGVLPKELDFFGMNTANDDDDDEFADTFGVMDTPEEEVVAVAEDGDDDVDDMFGSDDDDDDDDMFGSDDSEETSSSEEAVPEEVVEEAPHVPVEEYPAEDEGDDNDDGDDDLEALFG